MVKFAVSEDESSGSNSNERNEGLSVFSLPVDTKDGVYTTSINQSGSIKKTVSIKFDVEDSGDSGFSETEDIEKMSSMNANGGKPLLTQESTKSLELSEISEDGVKEAQKLEEEKNKPYQEVHGSRHISAFLPTVFRFWGGLIGRLDFIFETFDPTLYENEKTFKKGVEEQEGQGLTLAARKNQELKSLNLAGRLSVDGSYQVDDR